MHLCLCSLQDITAQECVLERHANDFMCLHYLVLTVHRKAQSIWLSLSAPSTCLSHYVSCNTCSYLTYCNNALLGGLHRVKVRAEKHNKHNIRWASNPTGRLKH